MQCAAVPTLMKLPLIVLAAAAAVPIDTGRFLRQKMHNQSLCTIEVPLLQHPEHRKRLHREFTCRTVQELAMHNGLDVVAGKEIFQQLCLDPVF